MGAHIADILAARDAEGGGRIPDALAAAIMEGESAMRVYRRHRGLTLQALAGQTGLAASHLSEIERGRKAGSAGALARIAAALGTTVDVLLIG